MDWKWFALLVLLVWLLDRAHAILKTLRQIAENQKALNGMTARTIIASGVESMRQGEQAKVTLPTETPESRPLPLG